jgi:hypothetical protein
LGSELALSLLEQKIEVGTFHHLYARAHHYERYGTSAEDIAAAINGLLDVVEAYRPGGAGEEVAPPTHASPRGGGARYTWRSEEEEEEKRRRRGMGRTSNLRS